MSLVCLGSNKDHKHNFEGMNMHFAKLTDLITVTLYTLQKYTSPSHLLWCL